MVLENYVCAKGYGKKNTYTEVESWVNPYIDLVEVHIITSAIFLPSHLVKNSFCAPLRVDVIMERAVVA